MWNRLKKLLLRYEFIIVLLCVITLIRLPSLFEPYWYGDEGIYLTLGQGMRHGLHLYRDIHDNKPPILYVIAAVAGSQYWFRFFLMLNVAASIVIFWRLALLWLSKKSDRQVVRIAGIEFPNILTPPALATIAFAILPFFAEWNIANGEIFMILPTLIGMLVLSRMYFGKMKPSLLAHAIAGFSFSLAFLIKVPSLFDVAAAGWAFFVLREISKKTPILHILFSTRMAAFVAAFLLPILITVGYYGILGAGEQYVRGAFAQNVGYLSSWSTGTHEQAQLAKSGLPLRAGILGVVLLLLSLGSLVLPFELVFLLIWFFCSLFGVLLSERPYPHYVIQVFPPLALIIGLLVRSLATIRKSIPTIILSVCAIGCLLFAVTYYKFWYYPLRPYYQNFFRYATRQIDRTTYFSYFHPGINDHYRAAEVIVRKTTPEDHIFIWGDLPTIYALTRRLPPGRYTSAYHIKDFAGIPETMLAIERNMPKLILIDSSYEPPFPQLQALLTTLYRPLTTTGNLHLYIRNFR